MRAIDELGLFWLPGHEDDALSGRLRFDPKDDGISLSLVGAFDSAPDSSDLLFRIIGWIGNDRVTLDRCFSHGPNLRSPGIIENQYSVNQMFVGHHFERDELPRRKLNAGFAEGRLPRSGTVRISSYFRTL
jgi:hypothetical protein